MPSAESPTASGGRGFRIILISTAIAGAAGYLIQAAAGWWLDPAQYAGFGVFWATLYFLVGAVAGIQQELARAARPVTAPDSHGDRARILAFAGIAALVVAVVVLGSAWLWAVPVFGTQWGTALAPLLVGAVSYVGFATLSGVLYGRMRWGLLGILIVIDPVLRLMTVVGALAIGSTALLDWAIVIPIPIALLVGLVIIAVRRRSPTVVDRPVRVLLVNAARTVLGSAATAVLISALPLFIAAGARDESAADVGALIFNVTITRAPLVIPILAFQGWLVVHFRDSRPDWGRRVARLLGGIGLAGVLLAVVSWFVVPPLVALLFGEDYALDPWLTAGIVLTASLTAALCASGALAIARNGHTAYLVGWSIAAGLAVVCLFLPLDLGPRLLVALSIGPAVGLAVHVAFLVRHAHDPARSPAADSPAEGVPEQ